MCAKTSSPAKYVNEQITDSIRMEFFRMSSYGVLESIMFSLIQVLAVLQKIQ